MSTDFSRAEGKPHMSYIIGKWPSRAGAPKPWKFRNEVEAEFCKRVKEKMPKK